jgi:serine/threonine protein kinase HipA of HipAB toxin-antitoxin module
MWLSNAYDMQWTRFLLGKTQTQTKFNALLADLKTTDKKYLIESVGQFYTVN